MVLILFCFAFLPPMLLGLYDGESLRNLLVSYGLASVSTLLLGLVLKVSTRSLYFRMRPGEAMAMVSMSWLVIAVLGFLSGRPDFLDLALLYGLINFVGTLTVLKFFEYGDLAKRMDPEDTP